MAPTWPNLFIDLAIASVVVPILAFSLPSITLVSSAVQYFYAGGGRRGEPPSSAGSGDGGVGAATAVAVLFVLKGVLLVLLLLQGGELLGGVGAAWLCAVVIEAAVRQRDQSLALLIEPAWQPFDYAFLLLAAPALCAPAAIVHGLVGAWTQWLCLAFFWRASSTTSATTAFVLAGAAYALAWRVGLFDWRVAVALALPELSMPLDADPSEEVQQIFGVALLLLIPSQTRVAVLPAALAFSPICRRRVLGLSEVVYHSLAAPSALPADARGTAAAAAISAASQRVHSSRSSAGSSSSAAESSQQAEVFPVELPMMQV